MTLRLLAVHAHPDDESSKGAATYASYVQAGIEVLIVSCTGGERGDILNETVNEIPMAHRDLTGLHRQEKWLPLATLLASNTSGSVMKTQVCPNRGSQFLQCALLTFPLTRKQRHLFESGAPIQTARDGYLQ